MDVVTIGETMVVLDPVIDGPLRYVDQFRKRIGGAESNLAIGLARLDKNVGWISQLGAEELGNYILSFIRGEGVDTSRVVMTTKASTGIYLKERTREENVQVYYYRNGSAASCLTTEKIDWNYIKQAKMVHLSGITPLLSDSCWEVVQQVFTFANKNNIAISFDPNIRTKLLDDQGIAKKYLLQLSERSNILLAGLDEAKILLDIKDIDEIIKHFHRQGVGSVILKDGANGVYYSSEEQGQGFVPSFRVNRVIDPIGAGDGFAAGVLSALLEDQSLENAVCRGAAIGAMVISTYGDVEGLPDKKTIEHFINGRQDIIR